MVTGISSPSSLLVIPTTAITMSAFFAAAIASGASASLTFVQMSCACGLTPFMVPNARLSGAFSPFTRWARPTAASILRLCPTAQFACR